MHIATLSEIGEVSDVNWSLELLNWKHSLELSGKEIKVNFFNQSRLWFADARRRRDIRRHFSSSSLLVIHQCTNKQINKQTKHKEAEDLQCFTAEKRKLSILNAPSSLLLLPMKLNNASLFKFFADVNIHISSPYVRQDEGLWCFV